MKLLAVWCPLVAALQPGVLRHHAASPAARGAARAPAAFMQEPPLRRVDFTPRSDVRAAVAEPAAVVDDMVRYYDSSGGSLAERMDAYVKARGGDRVIRRILIANNGMAATKSIMSIRN